MQRQAQPLPANVSRMTDNDISQRQAVVGGHSHQVVQHPQDEELVAVEAAVTLALLRHLGAEIAPMLEEAQQVDSDHGVPHLDVLGPVGGVGDQVHERGIVQGLVGPPRAQQRVERLLLLQQLLEGVLVLQEEGKVLLGESAKSEEVGAHHLHL